MSCRKSFYFSQQEVTACRLAEWERWLSKLQDSITSWIICQRLTLVLIRFVNFSQTFLLFFQISTKWGSVSSFVYETNYKSLKPKSRQIRIIKWQIHLIVFVLEMNLEANPQKLVCKYMNTSRWIHEYLYKKTNYNAKCKMQSMLVFLQFASQTMH